MLSSSRAGVVGRILAAALVAGAALLAGGATPAGAHATLIGTTPGADAMVDAVPDEVELQFDEPVETVENAVQVFGPGGDRVDLGTVELVDGGATVRAPVEADEPGTYTVAWRVTSEDSHTLSGSFVFHNGTRTGAVDVGGDGGDTVTGVAGGVGRWLALAGTLTAVGAATVALLRPRPGPGRPAPAPAGPAGGNGDVAVAGGPPGGDALAPATPDPRGAGAGPDAAGRATLADAVPATTATSTSGTPGDGGADAPATTSPPTSTLAAPDGAGAAPALPASADAEQAAGRLRAVTVLGALAGAAGAFLALVAMLAESAGRGLYDAVALVTEAAPDTRTGQLHLLRIGLSLAAGAAAAVAVLWRRSPLPALGLAAGALVATAIGGHAWTAPDRGIAVASDLAHLAAVAVWAGGLLALLLVLPLESAADRVRLTHRFSTLALGAVVVVAASGTVSGWQQVRSVDALTSTTYGRLLLAKVAGFAVLVVLGWLNRSRLLPLVERAVAPLQRALRVEIVVAALVVAVTAVLVHQPPARSAAPSGPYETTATAETGAVVDATVDPGTAGTNDIHLYFYADDGAEPLVVDAVQVTAGTADVPPRRLQVTPVSTNHVTVAGASLPSPGTWTIEVTAVQAGEPLIFSFEVPVT